MSDLSILIKPLLRFLGIIVTAIVVIVFTIGRVMDSGLFDEDEDKYSTNRNSVGSKSQTETVETKPVPPKKISICFNEFPENTEEIVCEGKYYGDLENELQTITQFKNLKKLKFIEVNLFDLSILAKVPQLEELEIWDLVKNTQRLRDNPLDISPIASLKNLKKLSVDNSNVNDISALKDLTNLEILWLQDNPLENISNLKKLTSLKELLLTRTLVKNVSSLCKLLSLEVLSLSGTKIEDLKQLSDCNNLKELSIGFTNISDLNPLSNLIHLEELALQGTQVTSIEPLKNLVKIERLELYNTKIKDLTPLSNLKNIKSLSIKNTLVNSLRPVRHMDPINISKDYDTLYLK